MSQLSTLIILYMLCAMTGCISMPPEIADELSTDENVQNNNYEVGKTQEPTKNSTEMEASP